jgi:hypothetical protein
MPTPTTPSGERTITTNEEFLAELVTAVESIRKSCEKNAAPYNLEYAMTQMGDRKVSLSAELLRDMFGALKYVVLPKAATEGMTIAELERHVAKAREDAEYADMEVNRCESLLTKAKVKQAVDAMTVATFGADVHE